MGYKTNNMKTTPIALILLGSAIAFGQARNWREHPAIRYSTAPVHDRIAELNQKLASGDASITFDSTFGYLKSVLTALKIPAESQLLVFSKTSFQISKISPQTPRALFFNDSVALGSVRDSLPDKVAGRIKLNDEQARAGSEARRGTGDIHRSIGRCRHR